MNKTNRFVGILVANQAQRKSVLKQYLPYKAADLKLFCFTPSSIDWNKKRITGLYRSTGKWVAGKFPFPQVLYNRCYDTDQEIITRLEAEIGRHRCFNQINRFDKLEIYNMLSRWLADYLPETIAYDEEKAVQLLENHKIIYLKPSCGHKGIGVYRAEWKNEEEIHIGQHYFSPEVIVKDTMQFLVHMNKLIDTTPYIIQKGIPMQQIKNRNFDIRALVQKNEKGLWSVTNLISRVAYKGSYNTSIFDNACLSQDVLKRLFPPKKVNSIVRSIYDVSLRTAEIIDTESNYHMGEFSVDFVLDNDAHPWIVELNGKPQKDLYNGLQSRSVVYRRPIEYAQYLCKP
ncbi:YheC/YheD family endospore coat-associated protein [Paenibacillus glycanilyticus]|uniref:YheC/YheD family endospore coat-associated protein n=1 Tax=Paenibacillus glycanilyticus TaxID=126569 RepID=UPI000FD8F490|nr:YheC/YheD family protein [Paenibacillus glycanilyticus]